jgi:hypothetical protein
MTTTPPTSHKRYLDQPVSLKARRESAALPGLLLEDIFDVSASNDSFHNINAIEKIHQKYEKHATRWMSFTSTFGRMT